MASRWTHLVNHHHPAVIEFAGTLLVHFTSFWLLSLVFLAVDLLAWPQLQKFKIQPLLRQPNYNAIKRCLLGAFINQLLTTSLHFLQLLFLYYLSSGFSSEASFGIHVANINPTYRVPPSLPSVPEFLTDLFLCTLLRETLFYYSHRLLHRPLLYHAIHAQHHRFRTPIALASLYAHPLEHIVCNLIPIAWPARLLDVHIVTLWAFIAGVSIQASLAHCGYDLKGVFGWKTQIHDLHHELGRGNYGLIGVLDWIHGTRYTTRKQD